MSDRVSAQPTVFLESLDAGYAPAIEAGLRETGFFGRIPVGSSVFLKPNLTFPTYRQGVMTSFECLAGVAECLVKNGYRVILGEADGGGYNRFSMDEVFRGLGIHALAERLGVRVVNLSFTEPELLAIPAGRKTLKVAFPRLLLREIDAFITLPVPKMHLNTRVSMSIKNQWGCIQVPSERLRLHPYFAEVMYAFSQALPASYSIIDGRFGLNRSGPLRGDPVKLNWLLVSDDLVAADRIGCRLLQIDDQDVPHLQHFRRQGWWPALDAIALRADWERFRREPFYLKRLWTDLPGVACFNNAFLAWLGYHSPVAGLAHRLLYLCREPFYDYEGELNKVRPTDGKPRPH
jgi:uncharacterized protein (DUF362 family)